MENNYKTKFKLLGLLLMATTLGYAQDTIPNAGFEHWTSGNCVLYSYNDANGWGDINSLACLADAITVRKTTAVAHVHSGTSALELITQNAAGQNAPGICATGTINQNTNAVDGGFPLVFRPFKFKGWYQYAPVSPDTFSVNINIYHGATTGTPIGTGSISGTTTVTAYTQFVIPIIYTDTTSTADSAQITLLNSAGASGQINTTMYVDDLSLVNCTGMTVSAVPTAATCAQTNGSAVATAGGASGPYTYLWSNSTSAASLSNVAAGTYTVIATDTDGCTARSNVVIGSTNAPFTVGVTPTASSCVSNTGTVTVTASGGNSPYTFVWNNSDTAHLVSNLGPGNYQVTVTDAHGCSSTGSGSVTTASGPSATDSVSNVACFGDSTGSVTVTVTGGTGNISYAWNNGASTQNLSGVPASNYALTITDANNCSFTVNAQVNQPTAIALSSVVTNIPCYGDSTGTINVSVSGGSPQYSFAWTGGGTTQNLSGLKAGVYNLVVTDSNSCTKNLSDTITQPTALTATTGVINASSQSASDGSAWVTPGGGTPPYMVNWTATGSSTDTVTHLAADTYAITISDSAGCTFATYAVVGAPTAIGNISNLQVSIYPNPANAQVVIQSNSADARFIFGLYSIDGQLVNEVNVTGNKTSVNLQQLSAGLYTYRLKDLNTGALRYGKLEVQH